MRIDADPKSPDFWALVFDDEVTVRLDGEKIEFCTRADDGEGFVDVLYQDAKGEFVVEGNGVKVERRRGAVEIIGKRRVFDA